MTGSYSQGKQHTPSGNQCSHFCCQSTQVHWLFWKLKMVDKHSLNNRFKCTVIYQKIKNPQRPKIKVKQVPQKEISKELSKALWNFAKIQWLWAPVFRASWETGTRRQSLKPLPARQRD